MRNVKSCAQRTGVLIERAGPSRSQPAHGLSAAAEAASDVRHAGGDDDDDEDHEYCAW